MHKPEIDVLLATCNGEQFLQQQLDSLSRQTFQNLHLIVRDDGSTDSTLDILERFRSRCPNSIEVYRNDARLGACRNFSLLTEQSTADNMFVVLLRLRIFGVWSACSLDSRRHLKNVEGHDGARFQEIRLGS